MSRVANKKLTLPSEVKYKVESGKIFFEGPKGKLSMDNMEKIKINDDNKCLSFDGGELETAMVGTFVMNFKNCVDGVMEKYKQVLNLYGVGYKVELKGTYLEFYLGYSHTIKIDLVDEVECEVKTPTQLILKSCNKRILGDFAAKIKKLRRVNPYKTKGIIAEGDYIPKKEGKK